MKYDANVSAAPSGTITDGSVLARNLRRGDKIRIDNMTADGNVRLNARVTRVNRHPSRPDHVRVLMYVEKCEYMPGFRVSRTYDLDDHVNLWQCVENS